MKTKEKQKCHLSHPTNPHNLSERTGQNPRSRCFARGKQNSDLGGVNFHYNCTTCKVNFHYSCRQIPRKITHPYHLQHPLTLTDRNYETKILSYTTYHGNQEPINISDSISGIVFDKCTWCEETLGSLFYRCSICSFCLDVFCAINVPILTIANPKSHHHSLNFFPRPLLVPCDACGLVNKSEPSYCCVQCNYVVHQSCIDLPRVIKITRHQHRLCYTPYLQPIVSLCRICYRKIDTRYGSFSCNQDDCSYVAHSKCATHEEVWDGKDLEWESDEPDQIEDMAPFKRIDVDLIEHFSHQHCLKLEKYDPVRDAEKQCQACILPIDFRNFYNCVECDFFLHEVCAGLLRKLDHALHNHSLVLDPSPLHNLFSMNCSSCLRASTGFRYICGEKDCMIGQHLQLDVRCIQVPDYFTHQSHEHPLFITSSSSGYKEILCNGCENTCFDSHLHCTVCEFALCYHCITIPTQVNYKYDEHPLILSYGEDTDDVYWCEICEKKLDPKEWFYTCNKCCICIHRQCLFGSSVYMKSGFRFYWKKSVPVEVVSNGSSSRPICSSCEVHCSDPVYYKWGEEETTNCSLQCLPYAQWDNLNSQHNCNRDQNCSYIVHSKCATHKNVWDGKELEWEPEEPDETEANAPFKRIAGDDLIEYFSHQHRLQLMKNYDDFRDADKQCEACTLPIDSKSFYNCVQIQCDFYLHQICANLPRKLDHALHMHPLALDASPLDDIQNFRICSACKRNSTGFRYVCTVKNSKACTYIHLDICCILVPEYFTHKSYQHPLFISTFSAYNEVFCKGCKNKFQGIHLQCSECNFALCYNCATIPTEIRYKHDEHLLSICYGESDDDAVTVAINGGYWCEKCEEKIDPKEWFYTCDKCCITIHHQCLFHSSDAFMKSGSSFVNNYGKVNVFANNGNTRPICFKCPRSRRCASSVYYKFDHANEIAYCSIACLDNKFS